MKEANLTQLEAKLIIEVILSNLVLIIYLEIFHNCNEFFIFMGLDA